MIHPDSRTLEWIRQVAGENKISDLALVEKTIRAFSLLEALVRSGCPFQFKGGSALLLHLDSNKRLSIDIDIICPPGTHIEDYLETYSQEYGFGEVKLVERISRTDVHKQHAKFFYQVAYNAGREQDKILLDVLFEDSHYNNVVTLPITSKFLKEAGDSIYVNLPCVEDMLGDKLTAFAPHTTGIPFFKGEKDCSMEINKQLFDIASLFDLVNDLTITTATFKKFASVELDYRGQNPEDVQSVLDDIYSSSYCITRNGKENVDEFKLLSGGISRIRGFIHSETYTIDRAIVNASKAAYLSRLISKGETKVSHYDPAKIADYADAWIEAPYETKLNKLKKNNFEAFYYWYQTYLLDCKAK